MKKIVLYGVRHVELRRDIEFFLDDGYEISGYSDTYYRSDVLDGKRFIPPEQLRNEEFDFIIPLSFRAPTLTDMISALTLLGISPQKIVRPTMFLNQGAEKMQVDLLADIEAQYQGETGLMFGLSYSLRGIFEKKLRPVFYDCSWHGLDIYYSRRIFQYMQRRYMLSSVRTALLVFPYYIFHYDMSRTFYHYRTGQMFALRGLKDWHNYQQTSEASEYIANYQMFGKKVSDFYRFRRYEQQNRGIYQGKDHEGLVNGAWFHAYPETVAENETLFAAFCHELMEENITPILIVPPYYLEGLNQASLAAVDQTKRKFYQIIETMGSVAVFDFFDVFANRREFFADLTHLNSDGAEAFTELINQTVLQGRKETDL